MARQKKRKESGGGGKEAPVRKRRSRNSGEELEEVVAKKKTPGRRRARQIGGTKGSNDADEEAEEQLRELKSDEKKEKGSSGGPSERARKRDRGRENEEKKEEEDEGAETEQFEKDVEDEKGEEEEEEEEEEEAQEEEDVEWEQVDWNEGSEEVDPVAKPDGSALVGKQTAERANKDDASSQIITIITEGRRGRRRNKSNDSAQKKKQNTGRTKKEKELAMNLHKAHLLCLLFHHYNVNLQLDDALLQASVLSILPPKLASSFGIARHDSRPTERRRTGGGGSFTSKLRNLVQFFQSYFELISEKEGNEKDNEKEEEAKEKEEGEKKDEHTLSFSDIPTSLMQSLERRKGTPKQITQLFVSLCRSLSMHTRYVCVVSPIPFSTNKAKLLKRRNSSSFSLRSKAKRQESIEDENDESITTPTKSSSSSSSSASTTAIRNNKDETTPPGNKKRKAEPVKDLLATFSRSDSITNLVTQKKHKATTTTNRKKKATTKKKKELEGDKEEDREEGRAVELSVQYEQHVWAELFSESQQRWIAVDVLNNYIDEPTRYEQNTGMLPFPYALSFSESSKSIRDVTRRYVARWSEAIAERCDEDWLRQTLALVSDPSRCRDQEDVDETELQALELIEPLPTTLAGFKNHPLYCLEKHLLKYEALYPRGPDYMIGEFKGWHVYPRSCVKMVRIASSLLIPFYCFCTEGVIQ
ncbi:Transglutaminase-like [Balamuthia mandrillaris]